MAEDIEQSYELDASAAEVFAELTEPARLDAWWTTRSSSDATEGGAFEYVWEFEDPSRNGRQHGSYAEVIPGKRLAYPWDGGGFETRVEFTIEETGAGSTLHLVHGAWNDDAAQKREEVSQGWAFFLGNLKSYLADGSDRRVEVLGQKISS